MDNRQSLRNVSLIVPVRNEEKRLARFRKRVDISKFKETIFVLNGCTDESLGELPKGRKKVLVFPESVGKGFALRKGFEAASGRIVCFVDADGAFSTSDIVSVCTRISRGGGAEIAIGKRRYFGNRTLLRRGFHILVKLLFRLEIPDTQCGLKALDRKRLLGIVKSCVSDGYEFPVELLWKAGNAKARIVQVPVNSRDEFEGSKFSPVLDPPGMLIRLLRVRFFG